MNLSEHVPAADSARYQDGEVFLPCRRVHGAHHHHTILIAIISGIKSKTTKFGFWSLLNCQRTICILILCLPILRLNLFPVQQVYSSVGDQFHAESVHHLGGDSSAGETCLRTSQPVNPSEVISYSCFLISYMVVS